MQTRNKPRRRTVMLEQLESRCLLSSGCNQPPVLSPIGNQAVMEGSLLSFTARANDYDGDFTRFSLDPGSPTGAAIDPVTGIFTWTPNENQGPDTHAVTVRVTDFHTRPCAQRRDFAVGRSPRGITMGDLNRDGRLDLVFTNGSSDVSVMLGTGNGLFGPKKDFPAASGVQSVSLVDLNQDGALDAVVTTDYRNDVSVLLGQRDGTFAPSTEYAVGRPSTCWPGCNGAAATGDVDEDGDLDIVATKYATGDITVLFNNGNGYFGTSLNYPAVTGYFGAYSLALGDLNNDAHLDVVVGSGWDVLVMFGNGNGTFQSPSRFPMSWSPRVALGDLNSDGNLDIVSVSQNYVEVMLGYGHGTFAPRTTTNYELGVQVTDFLLRDVNGDARLDLIATAIPQHGDSTVSILLGNGNGTFGDRIDYPVPATPYSLALGDVDDDGDFDFVTANTFADSVSVLQVDNGPVSLSDSETITILVQEVNAAPLLGAISDQSVTLGNSLSFTASATDSDVPANRLSFGLGADAPIGTTIDPMTGAFTWMPTPDQVGVHRFTVQVTDNGTPRLSDSQTIQVAVTDGSRGEIRGSKFEDRDGDGVWDAGEPGLAGWTIYLDLNENGILDSDEPRTVTVDDDPATSGVNEAGEYSFGNLPAGFYTVAEVQQSGWTQTFPSSSPLRVFTNESDWRSAARNIEQFDLTAANVAKADEVPSTPGQNAFLGETLTFPSASTGLRQSLQLRAIEPRISRPDACTFVTCGLIYFDVPFPANTVSVGNIGDHEEDDFVASVSGRAVTAFAVVLFDHDNGASESLSIFDEQGNLIGRLDGSAIPLGANATSFVGVVSPVPIGWIAFDEAVDSDDIAIFGFRFGDGVPSAGVHRVPLGAGQIVENINFGNQMIDTPGEIRGIKWNDLNGNGAREPNEPRLPGWTIYLDMNHDEYLNNPVSGESACDAYATEPCVITDQDGQYAFSGLPSGKYVVREVMQPGWAQTAPGGLSGNHTQEIGFERVLAQNVITDVQKLILAGDPGVAPFDSPANRVDPNTISSPFAGVVSLDLGGIARCSGSVIGPRYVLTAAHCLDLDENGRIELRPDQVLVHFNFGGNLTHTIVARALAIPPDYTGDKLNDDVGVITLSTPVPSGVPIYELSRNALAGGQTLQLVGYGNTGNGVTGFAPGTASLNTKRVGSNRFDAFLRDDEGSGQREVMVWDFDGPPAQFGNGPLGGPTLGNTVETQLGPGDSGGPAFASVDGRLSVAGISTFIGQLTGFPAPNGKFQSVGGGTIVPTYAEWIDSILGRAPGAHTVELEPGQVVDGKDFGNTDRAAPTFNSIPGDQDTLAPMVEKIRTVAAARGINAIVLSFNKPMQSSGAMDLANYKLLAPGRDNRFGTKDDRAVALRSAVYDPASHTVTITPRKPLGLNQLFQVTVGLMGTVTDLAGNPLDGNGDAGSPDNYAAVFGRGTRFTYADSDGDLVSLSLTRGGVMDFLKSANSGDPELRFSVIVAGRSTLTGRVMKQLGGDGRTTVSLVPTNGLVNNLPPALRIVNPAGTEAIDALLAVGLFTAELLR